MPRTPARYMPPKWLPAQWDPALKTLAQAQGQLNRFLWDSELMLAVAKQTAILDALNDASPADAFKDVDCAALRPMNNGKSRCRGTVRDIRRRLEEHTHTLFPAVLSQFFTHFEEYVRARFAGIFDPEDRMREVGRPVRVWRAIEERYPRRSFELPAEHERYTQMVLLRVDLLKWIRNSYAHVGQHAMPTYLSHRAVEDWERSLPADVADKPESPMLVEQVKKDTVGAAVRGTGKAAAEKRKVQVELFYAVFTFTNIRKRAEEMDRRFDREAMQATAGEPDTTADGLKDVAKQFKVTFTNRSRILPTAHRRRRNSTRR